MPVVRIDINLARGTFTETYLRSESTRFNFSLASYNGERIYLTGGARLTTVYSVVPEVKVFDIESLDFDSGPSLRHARKDHGSTLLGATLYVFAGVGPKFEQLASIEMLRVDDPKSDAWSSHDL